MVDVRDTADLDVFWGLYDSSMYNLMSIPKANINSTWQTCNYSFTYDGSRGETIPANTWVLAFRVTNGTNGVASGVTVDSLTAVPEPMAMVLLALGGLLIRRRI